MKPHYTRSGLDTYRAAVPLPLPLPPGAPSGWSCLYSLIGPAMLYRSEGYQELVPDGLLGVLLELLGRPCAADESRGLRLVTPIPGGLDLQGLLVRALRGREGAEAARLLGYLGDKRAVEGLARVLPGADWNLHEEALRALGRLGAEPGVIGPWDGQHDPTRLLAHVQAGRIPEELPTGELDPLSEWMGSFDPAAGRELLESADSLSDTLMAVVARVLALNPEVAVELAEPLVGVLERVPAEPEWIAAFAAAGEEAAELVVEGLGSEEWRVRMGAAMVLGHLELGTQAERALRGALSDDDPDVRREAGLSLYSRGLVRDLVGWSAEYGFIERAVNHPWGAALCGGEVPVELFAMLARRDGGELLGRVALTLAFAHPELAAPALEAIAVDPGFDVPIEARQAAAAGLLVTGVAPSGVGALHRLLLRGVGGQMPTGPMEGLRSEDLAILAARDADWQVRLAALGQLQRCADASRYSALYAVLETSDSDSDVRARARSMCTGGFRAVGVGPTLGALVVSSRTDSEARARALAELAELDASLAGPLASALIDHTDRDLAVLAGRIAGQHGSAEQVVDRVRRGLGQLRMPDWIHREAACALLGSLDPSGLAEDLFEELVESVAAVSAEDSDSDVRELASWAVTELRRRRG